MDTTNKQEALHMWTTTIGRLELYKESHGDIRPESRERGMS